MASLKDFFRVRPSQKTSDSVSRQSSPALGAPHVDETEPNDRPISEKDVPVSERLLLDIVIDDSETEEPSAEIQSIQEETVANHDHILVQFKPPKDFKFPKRAFGAGENIRLRGCNSQWFDDYPWLHYVMSDDAVLCYTCTVAARKGLTPSSKVSDTYTKTGFSYWNDGSRKLKKHQESNVHSDCVKLLDGDLSGNQRIDEALDKALKCSKDQNNSMLVYVIRALLFLSRQNLAIRGKYNSSQGDFIEPNSNLIQLLQHDAEHSPELKSLLTRSQTYTCPDVQNELLQVMSDLVTEKIMEKIMNSKHYSIMVDETTDCSNKEQMVFCLRSVDENLIVSEDYMSLSVLPNTSSDTLFDYVKQILLQLNLPLEDCRGQCYDGAASMQGARNGLKTRVLKENAKAIYIHCFGHSLNLSVQDTIKTIPQMRDLLDTAYEITKLVKKSPKRETLLTRIKEEMSSSTGGVRTLCATRWTIRADCLKSILKNYGELLLLWDRSLAAGVSDTDMKARILGVQSQMSKFSFLMLTVISETVMRVTDNLATSLQASKLSASEGRTMAERTVDCLTQMRNENKFEEIYEDAVKLQKELDIDEPQLPRKRRMPQRYEEGAGEAFHHQTPQDLYRSIYYEVLDKSIQGIQSRFDQPGYRIMANMEQMLIAAANGETASIGNIHSIYCDEFNFDLLQTQLEMLKTLVPQNLSIKTFSKFLEWFNSSASRHMLSEVKKVIRLILVLPATNAISERSFSTLRRVKTYLRSTMTEVRLNSLMKLHIYRDLAGQLDYQVIIKRFVGTSQRRLQRIAVKC